MARAPKPNGRGKAVVKKCEAMAVGGVGTQVGFPSTRRRSPAPSARPAAEVGKLRELLGLNQGLMARLLGVSLRTVAGLDSGEARASGAVARRLVEVSRFHSRLARLVKLDAGFMAEWLQTPNATFGGLKPLEVIERGEMDRLWAMIYDMESGNLA